MLNELSFKNYGPFKNKQTIKIRPITILVGPNSAGKSSILKLLRLLNQTVRQPNGHLLTFNGDFLDINRKNFSYRDNKKPVTIELFFKKYPRSLFRFSLGDTNISKEYDALIDELRTGRPTLPEKLDGDIKLSLTIGNYSSNTRDHVEIISNDFKLNYEPMGSPPDQGIYSNKEGINDIEIFKILEKSSLYNHYDVIGVNQIFKDGVSEILGSLKVQSDISPSDYFVPHNPFYAYSIKLLALQIGEALEIPLLEDFSLDHLLLRENVEWQEDYPDTIRQLFEKKETLPEETLQFLLNVMVSRCFQKLPGLINANRFPLNELRSEVERSLQFRYLGPLRPAPRKFYSGDALWTELFYPSVHDSDKLVTKYLNIMGLEYDFKKMKVSSSNDLHSLVLVDRKNKYRSNYADMGFGFSQIMPIIFSRLQGGITIIEQPELHLHPKAQSKLALLFAYDLVFVKKHAENDMTRIIAHPSEERLIYIGKFEYDKIAAIPITDTTFRNSGTVIIETHSEHLIRGLQLQVAKGIISSRNIALYYVGKNKDGSSSVEQIEMSEKGTFATDWPGELFEDGFRQASELLSLN